MRRAGYFLLAVALLSPGLAAADGLWTEVLAGATTTVTVNYGRGTPLTGAPFTVLPPGGDQALLTGTTDDKGRVTFRPDRPGVWYVRIVSTDGHSAAVRVDIDRRALAGGAPPTAAAHFNAHSPLDTPAPATGPTAERTTRDTVGALYGPRGGRAWPPFHDFLPVATALAVILAALGGAFLVFRHRRS